MKDIKHDNNEHDIYNLVIENSKLLLAAIDNKKRIDDLETKLYLMEKRHNIFSWIVSLNYIITLILLTILIF